jgi:hypothetical protein
MSYQTLDGFYIPARMMSAIKSYVEKGEIPGDFLQAVICNNLKDACGRADRENLRNLPAYVSYFFNEVPSTCWGSREKMLAWADTVAGRLPPTEREPLDYPENTPTIQSADLFGTGEGQYHGVI